MHARVRTCAHSSDLRITHFSSTYYSYLAFLYYNIVFGLVIEKPESSLTQIHKNREDTGCVESNFRHNGLQQLTDKLIFQMFP